MPDFNDQFSRFMDQFQRDSRDNSRSNEETANTLRELLEEQRKMREHAEEMARQRAVDDREAEMELERERKRNKVVDVKANKHRSTGNDTLRGLFKDLKKHVFSPTILASAIGLAVADQITSVNLRETLFAGTILSKVGSTRLLTAFKSVAGAPGKMATSLGKSLQVKGGMTAKGGKAGFKLGGGMEYMGKGAKGADKLGRVKVTGGMKTARIAGTGLKAVGSTSGGILSIITSVLKPLKSILKPFMSVLKLAGKATMVLTPIIAIIEGVVKAMKVFQEGGSISEVIFGFLMGALESLTIGLLEGIATLGNWLVTMFEAIPDIVGDIIDGVFDFVASLFGGETTTPIGQMLLDFVYKLGSVLKDVGLMAVRLIWALFKMVPKILWKLSVAIGGAIWGLGKMLWNWVKDLWKRIFESEEETKARYEKEAAIREREEAEKQALEEQAHKAEMDDMLKGMQEGEAAREEQLNLEEEANDAKIAAAKSDKDAAQAQADDAKDRKDEIVGKLKGLGELTKGLMKTYGSAVKTFMDDPSAGVANISQASAKGKKRTYGGFDFAQKLDPFGGERNMFEKTDAAQNAGINVLNDSMGAEMDKRRKDRAASAVAVNAPTTVTNTTNAKTHSHIPRGTRHTDRSLDKANRRDRVNM
jgi:hypothetical protein